MSIWRPTPASIQPVVTLVSWQAFDVPYNDPAKGSSRHFLGLALESGNEGRTSSPILEFDALRAQGKTGSGRIYRLQGMPGVHLDTDYVWRAWLQLHGNPQFIDVTEEVFCQMMDAQRMAIGAQSTERVAVDKDSNAR